MRKLVNLTQLSTELGIPKRSLRTMYQGRKITFIRAGHRTLLFNPETVMSELEKLTVRAVR
jgi:hypothetical protein